MYNSSAPSCVWLWHVKKKCAHVKDLIIHLSYKKVCLTAGGMETRKHSTQGKKEKQKEARQLLATAARSPLGKGKQAGIDLFRKEKTGELFPILPTAVGYCGCRN